MWPRGGAATPATNPARTPQKCATPRGRPPLVCGVKELSVARKRHPNPSASPSLSRRTASSNTHQREERVAGFGHHGVSKQGSNRHTHVQEKERTQTTATLAGSRYESHDEEQHPLSGEKKIPLNENLPSNTTIHKEKEKQSLR